MSGYEIVKSSSDHQPYLVVWRSGSFIKPKGKYTDLSQAKARVRQLRAALNRKAREQAMKDLGLVKVRGALGGVYFE